MSGKKRHDASCIHDLCAIVISKSKTLKYEVDFKYYYKNHQNSTSSDTVVAEVFLPKHKSMGFTNIHTALGILE